MSARELTKGLGGSWHGNYGLAKCPSHNDRVPSLQVSDGDNGNLQVFCHAGCDWRDIKTALRSRDLMPEWAPPERAHRHLLKDGRPLSAEQGTATRGAATEAAAGRDINTKYALELWHAARPAGVIAETYFANRGITTTMPPTIRETPGLKHRPSRLDLPAIICAVQAPDGKVVAIHRTFLKSDFSAKANVNQARMMLGPLSGNTVRLAPAAQKMALAEGLENGLSVLQACPSFPVWCGLSAGNLAPQLPAVVKEVILCIDGDLPGSPAFEASEKAAQKLIARGLRVRKFRAPPRMDHNDLLQLPANVVPLKTKETANG